MYEEDGEKNLLKIKLKLKKKKGISITVPRNHHADVIPLVDAVLSGGKAGLYEIKQVKTFAQARLDGMGAMEAKRFAGINPNKPVANIVNTPVAIAVMENLLKEHYGDKKIIDKIKDLWTAEDTKFSKEAGFYKTPNWEAQKNGLDRVLELRGYKKKDSGTDVVIPTQINFNVQTMPPEAVIETKIQETREKA